MNIRLYNARILSLAGDMSITEGEVWVRDDLIHYVGSPKASSARWDVARDMQGDLLLPGFKNAHTHSAMTFLRSFADDLPLEDWLDRAVFPMEALLTDEDVYHLSRLAILEYLTSGITASFDMYRSPAAIARASRDCGFRTVLSCPLNDFTGSIAETEACFAQLNAPNDLISYRLGFHAVYTTSEPLLRSLSTLAHTYRAPIFAHLSETAAERADCLAKHGLSPIAYADSLGLFDFGGGVYHGVHVSAEDIAILCKRHLSVISCPASNCKLASGIAPLCRFAAAGIPLALGTDGAASNNCLDMFREMFLATALQKLQTNDAAALGADTVLRMATLGGAHAMGLPYCDTLAAGKKADLIRIDLSQPNMQPLNNIPQNLVYSGCKQNVRMTMVNGRVLYEDGQFFIGDDPQTIYRYANDCVRRMQNQI